MCSLVDENIVTRDVQEPNPVFPPGAMVQCSLIQCLQGLIECNYHKS